MELTICRTDFRDPIGDIDFFEDGILANLGIPKNRRQYIIEITIKVDEVLDSI